MSDDIKCCVCGKSVTQANSTAFRFTAEEKKALQALDQPVVEECSYCRGCLKLLSNRERGAQLLKGVLQMNLRMSGVANAEQHAEKFHDFLLKKAARNPLS